MTPSPGAQARTDRAPEPLFNHFPVSRGSVDRRRKPLFNHSRSLRAQRSLVLQDSLTVGEQTLAEAGQGKAVLELRRRWQDVMQESVSREIASSPCDTMERRSGQM